jgi:hypothetical protein
MAANVLAANSQSPKKSFNEGLIFTPSLQQESKTAYLLVMPVTLQHLDLVAIGVLDEKKACE